MPTKMGIEIKGADRIRRNLDRDRLLLPGLGRAITRLALLGEREAKLGAPRDTGNLQRSIVAEVRPLEARVHVIGTAKSYAEVMEFGRRRGAPIAFFLKSRTASHFAGMPPPEALRGWARRHGFGSDQGALFVLARAIARRGIKGRFFMRRAVAAVKRDLPGAIADFAKDVTVRWKS